MAGSLGSGHITRRSHSARLKAWALYLGLRTCFSQAVLRTIRARGGSLSVPIDMWVAVRRRFLGTAPSSARVMIPLSPEGLFEELGPGEREKIASALSGLGLSLEKVLLFRFPYAIAGMGRVEHAGFWCCACSAVVPVPRRGKYFRTIIFCGDALERASPGLLREYLVHELLELSDQEHRLRQGEPQSQLEFLIQHDDLHARVREVLGISEEEQMEFMEEDERITISIAKSMGICPSELLFFWLMEHLRREYDRYVGYALEMTDAMRGAWRWMHQDMRHMAYLIDALKELCDILAPEL